jgi:hypothetical protein
MLLNVFRFKDFAAVVVAARGANMMGPHQFTAILALDECLSRQPVVGPAHVTFRLGDFLLWNRHQVLPLSF